jgi:hypothetical protein
VQRPLVVRRSRRWFALIGAVAVVLGGCRTIPVPAGDVPPYVSITTSPGTYPTFKRSVHDYVARCNQSNPIRVSVAAPAGFSVSVNGGPYAVGSFQRVVTQGVGERFRIAIRDPEGVRTKHFVRCLPQDFPRWTSQQHDETQSQFYVVAPSVLSTGVGYASVFDTNGVPLWWARDVSTISAFPIDDTIGWYTGTSFEQHAFDGSLLDTFSTVGQPIDLHDLVVLPNGNHLVVSATPKSGVSLASWGGPANATILDHIVQEVTPAGAVAWSWRVSDHISVNETSQHWREAELAGPGGPHGEYDPYHWNSIEWTDGGVLLSFRHLDALYKVNRSNGAIAWKLGGSTRPGSLTVLGDPKFAPGGGGGFGGQHDARILSDGTLTLYDDGTERDRPPRGVAYRLDLTRRTATLVTEITDPAEPTAFCCGSFRQLVWGNYVIGWGGTDDNAADVTETTPDGRRVFELTFPQPTAIAYRAIPFLPDVVTVQQLRNGMDAQYAN